MWYVYLVYIWYYIYIYMLYIIISPIYVYLVGGSYPSEKYESQLGLLFPVYGKIKNVPNHQPDRYIYIYCVCMYIYIYIIVRVCN